jgi:hypothetical protein
VTVEIRDRYLRQVYEAAWARHQEALRLGLQEMHKADMFPSTVEGSRGAGSPLGTGFAKPAAEQKETR